MAFTNKQLKDVKIFGSPLKINGLKLKTILGVGDSTSSGISSSTLPNNTLLTVTEDVLGNNMDFGIGVFTDWDTDFNTDVGTNRGFYYGPNYEGIGLVNNTSGVNINNTSSSVWAGQNASGDIRYASLIVSSNVGGSSFNLTASDNSSPRRTSSVRSYLDAANAGITIATSSGTIRVQVGSGSPEGVVTANPGTFYSNVLGGAGTTFYVKETGTGNTGWAAK